ncbi:repetitive organellar protein-like isoform X3 [Maniola jurtina]|uniref:repetitive organellar protein-like isoform X3 n=1 Tax=Maniola jurtina TaxID=191418 RepID=UPI001E68AEA4|nr:repetitive organellar protein-like isoform X3 [Maniola jurtina]
MDDEIPQSFKVQWVYTTLRYLKDDTQMIMEYPEMPVNHMEYLHNLIWQRKHEVGLGVRSMYAPVWETMRIFSSKYRYKVFVNKSADGTKGYLVIEKIPKKENQEPDTQENLERANEIPDCQSSDSESESSQSQLESSQSQLESSQSHLESNQSQPESPVHYPVGTQPKKTNTIAIRKKTKSEKFLISKHKIIESISPVLLRKTLQHILDFLLKKEEASIIFSDLAPVEAKFLENFLGIFNKRISFRDILSPACNELLDKMCEFFKEFDKACKLEVYAAKYNVHTKKREVTFMKVPRYTRSNANESIPAVKKIDKPTISKIRARSLGPTDRSVGPTNRSLGPRKDRLLVAMSTPLESDKAMRMMRLMGWQGGALGPRGDGIVEPIIPALDIVRGKGFGHVVKEKPKSTKPVKPVKKSKVEEKSKPVKTSQTEDRLKPVQTCQTEEKLNPVDTPQTEERLKPVKTSQTEEKLKPVKTLEERLKPFKTSPTEEKLKPVTSQIKEEPPKPVKLNRRVLDRMEFLHKILDLISKDRARREQAVTYPVKLCQRQKICYDNIICVLNKRKHTSITLTEHENEILKEIASVMDTEPHLTLDMMVSSDQRELTITKKIDFVVNTTDRMRWPTLSKETQDLQENVNLEKKMTKSEFEIHICSTVLEFLISEDSERWIDFDAALTEKCCDVVETICSCVNNKVAIPYKPVKELSDKILQVNNACFLDVQFYAKPTRSILLRKLNCRKPAINTEVIKNIIKRCIDTTVPNADDANNQRKPETIKASNKEANKQNTDADINTNKATANNTDNTDKIRERLIITNDISKPDSTASHPSIDSIHYSAVDDKVIQENMRKRNVRNECNGTKLNNSTVNSSEDIMAKASEKFKWFPLYAKDMNTGDNNDFRRIDIDLIQVTINLLTYNNNNNNTDTIPNDHENNDFNINDNSKYIESSKLNDKLDIPCKITDNMRKWYDRSEKFLICDDITTLVEIKNSSYNNDQVTNVEINKSIGVKVIHAELNISTTTDKTKNCCKADTNDSIESEILNEDVEKQSQFDEKQIENVSQNLKLIDEYEVSDGIRGSTDDVESKESHQTGDKSSQSDTIQVKANNSEDLKSKYVPDVCSDSQNSDVIIVSESHQEVKNHSKIEMIQLESIKVDKQAFEAFNDIKATINEIESEISNQIKTHTKSDIILIDGNSSENLNATSLNEVLTNTKDSKTEIGSKESHPVDRKHSELDIVEIEKEELSDYGSEESFDTDEIMQVIRQNEDCLSDCETDNSSETLQTDEANSNLDIIQVDSNYEEDSTLKSKNEPKESLHNEETHSMKEKNEMEANNIKDIKRTNEFERDETRKELKEVEIETKLEMSIIKTNCNENLSRKRKYEATELDESYEAVEVKHKFCITSINDDNIEDLRLISRTVDSEDSEKTKEINSKLDIIHTGTDSKENSTLEREFGLELPEESHKIDETSSKSDGLRVSENYEEIATLESEFKIGLPEESHKIDEIIIDANSKLGAGYKENLPLENEFKVELLEESDKIDETDSKSDELRVEENYEEIPTLESEFKIGLLEESHLIDEINSKLAVIQVGMDYTENSRLKSEFEEELLQESHKIDETNSKLDVFQVREDNKENLAPESGFKTELLKKVHKIDEINSKLDTGNDSKHANETQIKDLNNRNKEIDKTCHDIVLIESNILETEVIQRKIQNAIENMDSETEFLPLLKYHGILNKGIIYSCHNKGTSVWLRNILPDHSVIDYKSAINNHKLKVKAISFNKNAKKFLELLEVYNQGIKSRNWKIISEKYYKNNLLIVRVEMDSNSFEYVCDNNFSLFVGYDIAQFTIGC